MVYASLVAPHSLPWRHVKLIKTGSDHRGQLKLPAPCGSPAGRFYIRIVYKISFCDLAYLPTVCVSTFCIQLYFLLADFFSWIRNTNISKEFNQYSMCGRDNFLIPSPGGDYWTGFTNNKTILSEVRLIMIATVDVSYGRALVIGNRF